MVNKLWTVCIFILIVEVAERLCYYSISGTQRNFLTDLPGDKAMDQGAAGAINSVFTMLSYLSCFLGGYLADQWLGRYKTIVSFAFLYFLGTVMVAISANQQIYNVPLYLAGCLVFISLGTGAIKPNVMTFGAAQYDENDPEEKKQQKTFFSYFYMMINLGAGVSFMFLTNIATDPVSFGIPAGDGFFDVYLIAAGCMGFAVLSFLAGTCRYKKEEPAVHKPMISVMAKYMWRSGGNARGMMALTGWILLPIYIILNLVGSIIDSLPTVLVCMGLCVLSCVFLVLGHLKNDWIKEFEKEIEGAGLTLADAKQALALVPQLLIINVGFNIPYNAMNNAYPTLACQMDLRLPWNHAVQLNGAFTNLGDCFAIIIGIPIIEEIIIPCFEKRQNRVIARRSKYIFGFLLCCLANATAVAIEFVRRQQPFIDDGEAGLSKCAPLRNKIHMSQMSCFWAFIPMFMTGISEILVNPVVYQFAFTEAPTQLLSIVQAFNLVVAGSISNCITGPLSIWLFPENLNNFDEQNILSGVPGGRGDVNVTFYVNIAIGLLCLLAYMVIEKMDEVKPENLSLSESLLDNRISGSMVIPGHH